jgi:hypothetical protein
MCVIIIQLGLLRSFLRRAQSIFFFLFEATADDDGAHAHSHSLPIMEFTFFVGVAK